MSDEHRPDATVGDPDQWTAAGEDTDGSAAVDGPGIVAHQENATQPSTLIAPCTVPGRRIRIRPCAASNK